jgi:hypothetical protein
MKYRRLLIFAALVAATCTFAPPTYYTAPIVYFGAPIHGRVVDAETQKPIEGAVVAVEWEMIGSWGRPGRFVEREVLTDANGKFRIPGWGPRFRSPIGGVLENDPTIWVLKTAYGHYVSSNRKDSNAFIRRSESEGKTIALPLDREEHERHKRDLNAILRSAPNGPLLLQEIAKERERIRESNTDAEKRP